jgi:glycosyltransferase involved in cell wall biosynthesis
VRWRTRHTRAPEQARVLVLNWRDPWHPEGGGSELYIQQVAHRLAGSGLAVTVFSAQYPGSRRRETLDGLTYVRRGGHLTVYLWAALFLVSGRFGRLGAVLEVQNGMPFLARLFTRARVVVLVHHVHREQWPVVGPVLARIGWFMESRVAVRVNRSATYVTVSDVTRDELVGLGVQVDRILLAPNGLPPVPEFRRLERANHPRLVVLSRLVPHKQVEHAIAAAARLTEEFPDLRLDVIGSGWWEDKLRATAAEQGVADRVTFLGHVTDEVKFERLSQAWIHVLPSLKEGWGLSVIEAAYVGVPSIAYRSAGGVQESVQDGVTGLLADSFEDFVECTRWLLVDEALRRSLGDKAEIRVEQFSWETTTAVIRGALRV